MTVYVLDTSAFLHVTPTTLRGELLTAKEVIEEAKSLELQAKVETALVQGVVKVVSPSSSALRKVKQEMKRTGDRLSVADIKVLAIALERKEENLVLLTDDYAMQNLAERLGVRYRALRTPGIKKTLKWIRWCPACKREVKANAKECPVCGTKTCRRALG